MMTKKKDNVFHSNKILSYTIATIWQSTQISFKYCYTYKTDKWNKRIICSYISLRLAFETVKGILVIMDSFRKNVILDR